jgi:hypothetical protein
VCVGGNAPNVCVCVRVCVCREGQQTSSSTGSHHTSDGTSGERRRRAATARTERLWEHGVIPYEIDANFSGEPLVMLMPMYMHGWAL